jgi:hypothetical protein
MRVRSKILNHSEAGNVRSLTTTVFASAVFKSQATSDFSHSFLIQCEQSKQRRQMQTATAMLAIQN